MYALVRLDAANTVTVLDPPSAKVIAGVVMRPIPRKAEANTRKRPVCFPIYIECQKLAPLVCFRSDFYAEGDS